MENVFLKRNFILVLLMLVFVPFHLWSQQQLIPYVKSYSKLDYDGEALVWSISQTADKQMYFANNKYLLQFDGHRWQKFSLPKKTIIRSVYAKGNVIYSGSLKEFGFWKNSNDSLAYTSISQKFNCFKSDENDEVWKILEYDGKLIFQTFFSLFVYDGKSVNKYKTPSQISYVFNVKDKLYACSVFKGIYLFDGENFVVDKRFDVLKGKIIHSMIPYKDEILIFTLKDGVFVLKNNVLSVWENALNETFKNEMVSSVKVISENVIAVGTSGNGMYLVDLKVNQITNFHKTNGSLQNNTVLSIYKDAESNLWLGLDNGISFIQNDANAYIFQDYTGKLGSVNSVSTTNNGFFLGSNRGFFKFENKEINLISGTQGPIWSVAEIGNKFILGHNTETILVENNSSTKLNNLAGGYKFLKLSDSKFIQSNYTGLYLYEYKSGKWGYEKIAPELTAPINNFIQKDNTIWASDAYKGIYRVDLANNSYEEIKSEKGLEIYNGKIVEINNQIYFLSNQVWYEYDTWTKKLKRSERLNQMLPYIDNVAGLEKNMLLVQSSESLSIVKIEDQKIIWKNIPEKYYKGKIVNDWLSPYLQNGYLFLNLDNGFLKYKISFENTKRPTVYIEAQVNGEKMPSGKKIGYYNNAVDFYISTREYGYSEQNLYYKLLPLDDTYRPLKDGKLNYSHLSNGSYKLSVAIKSGNYYHELKSFEFRVKKPWFISNLMIVFYVLSVFLIYFLYHSFIQRQNKQKLEQLQHEVELQKELVKMKSEAQKKEAEHWVEKQKLEHDVKSKTTELASRALSIASQSELLIELESIMKNIDEDANSKTKKDIAKILRDYNYNQNEWKVFDTNLHELHEDFISRLVKSYPNLTSKDIRLAILLRMNMTSKEIAPLMRKSFRSVELQRYRLRKKMKLSSQTNLSKFFLNF
ncbi:two-component regulator propeller domain-containing protein [Moheibacter sediminis]|uniref:HTH luxR-type domain-containing protein n=1 Tax=Moheibacter sediminis TaxID=1434700 RepID=A0A1W2C1X6_9FLAO|nr:two-component regulator propeller domain-containing protein [Moheibacter sediminis]SMC79189.1 hypothetical protein SAMN06296427_10870 [Moheibacter sediminis]